MNFLMFVLLYQSNALALLLYIINRANILSGNWRRLLRICTRAFVSAILTVSPRSSRRPGSPSQCRRSDSSNSSKWRRRRQRRHRPKRDTSADCGACDKSMSESRLNLRVDWLSYSSSSSRQWHWGRAGLVLRAPSHQEGM